MAVTVQVTSVPGIESASVVMALGHQRRELAAQAGLGTSDVRPNDLVVAVAGPAEAWRKPRPLADKLLSEAPGGGAGGKQRGCAHDQHPDGRHEGS